MLMINWKGFVFFGCILFFLFAVPVTIFAQETDPRYTQKLKEIEELQGKISQLQGEAKTLSSAIGYLTQKKSLTQKQIESTEFEIEQVKLEIAAIGGKIATTEKDLDAQVRALITAIDEGYKKPKLGALEYLFSSKSFGEMQARAKYVEFAKARHSQILQKTAAVKLDYDKQKSEKESAQKKIESLQKKLAVQKKDLELQETAKKQLLLDTKNSESSYQKLLAAAQAELSAFRAFTAGKGGGLLPPQNSPDGWYYSQRDSRWGLLAIGNSFLTSRPDTIHDVGCLVSSVAMVLKKFGSDATPASVASQPAYFYLNTASMRRPWPAPSGYFYTILDRRDTGLIDSQLASGNPVVVKLSVRTNAVGTHFVVLKSGSGGNYTMHDPWEGYDKNFSSYYSVGQIISIGLLAKK